MVTYLTDHSDWLISALRLLIFFKIIAHHPIFRKTCVDTYAPTPLQKGGAYLGFLADVCHRLPLKNQVLFLTPFLKGGWGGFAFHRTPKRP